MSRIPQEILDKVRERAGERCEYCRKIELASNYPHHVDRIIAIKHEGSSELSNLAWACFQCNSAKSSDIASFDVDTKSIIPLFNPRLQVWDKYFELQDALIVGKTPTGRVTVRTLQMNYPEQVETRRSLIKAGLW